MPRTEVYQLRLTKDEKADLAGKASARGISIAKLIRQAVGLGTRGPVEPSRPKPKDQAHEARAEELSHGSPLDALTQRIQVRRETL